MEQELRTIIQDAWCAGENIPVQIDTFGAFLDRASKAIMEAGYWKQSREEGPFLDIARGYFPDVNDKVLNAVLDTILWTHTEFPEDRATLEEYLRKELQALADKRKAREGIVLQ